MSRSGGALQDLDHVSIMSDQVPIHPLRLCKVINDFLTEDTIFIGDGGDSVMISASVYT